MKLTNRGSGEGAPKDYYGEGGSGGDEMDGSRASGGSEADTGKQSKVPGARARRKNLNLATSESIIAIWSLG